MKHPAAPLRELSKIIPFPAKTEPEETYGSVLRGVLEQSFPKETWLRLKWNRETQFRARIVVNRVLACCDYGQRMKHLIAALVAHYPLGMARKVAAEILIPESKRRASGF